MKEDKSGRSLENAVGRIQQLLDPKSTVTYRERITNRLNITREFDVVIRGTFGGHPVLGVIECKDWKTKVGTLELDAFINKSRDINASLRMMVSAKGFTQPALDQAKHEGVGVFSLLPTDTIAAGFSVGILWYGKMYEWGTFQMWVDFEGKRPPSGFRFAEIRYFGAPVVNLLFDEIVKHHNEFAGVCMILRYEFRRPLAVVIDGESYLLKRFTLFAPRSIKKKCKFLQVTGDAMYDWINMRPVVPESGGSLSVHGIKFDLSDWDDFEGEFPQLRNMQMHVNSYRFPYDPKTESVPLLANGHIFVEKFGPEFE